MAPTIAGVAEDARDTCAGLQIFYDNIRPRDPNLGESIRELLVLHNALLRLGDGLQHTRIDNEGLVLDVRLLLQSMSLTLLRVEKMFGDTKNVKLDGRRPYNLVWTQLSNELAAGIPLLPRLQLYSLFLNNILLYVQREPVDRSAVRTQKDMIERLVDIQRRATAPPPPPPPRPAPERRRSFRMPGAFPTAPEVPNPYGAQSPTESTASWQTWGSSQTGSSIGSMSGHWASDIFNGQHPSSKFPRALREPSKLCGEHEPRLSQLLAKSSCRLMARLSFEADDVEARYYCGPDGRDCRLILMTHDAATNPIATCSLVKRLKVTRDRSALEVWRNDKKGVFKLWAKLSFIDIERLVLFYSTFVALKIQDHNPADGELERDYYNIKEEIRFSGTTIYYSIDGRELRHALRVLQDKYTKAIRIESRPLRGTKGHVPIWVSFLPNDLRSRGWIRRTGPQQVELKKLDQHVFVGQYVPPLGRNERFLIDFVQPSDANDFIRCMQDHLAE